METQQQAQSKKFKILVIGDSCIDEYIYGDVTRLNPESPVPILEHATTVTKKGMAANVYNNVLAFGCDADLITNEEEITKTRYIDRKSKQHLLRVDKETEIKPAEYIDTSDYDAVIISDYNKGFVTWKTIDQILDQSDIPVFLDTKKDDLIWFAGCFIKINELEYNNCTSLPAHNVIVTLGGKGAMYDGELYPAKKVDVVDVCGAGDTFLAALCIQYLETNNMEQAIQFANKASAITVQHSGVYAPTKEEIGTL
jgi:bifunctional ADP-heptose synthase (sugar kinase/adenylyltransferase)